MLIRDAELEFGARKVDLRIVDGVIREIAPRLPCRAGEEVVDAGGGALLPGLHDHHIHLHALAAAQASVSCGPPQVESADELAAVLRAADAEATPGAWLRGVSFHESVMDHGALPDRGWLDRVLPQRPLRMQHRSGRLWLLNSAALRQLGVADDAAADNPLERIEGRPSGRLYDADDWLRARVGDARPSLADISRRLWNWGVTGVTDTGYANGLDDYHALAAAQQSGELLQDVLVMGNAELDTAADGANAGCYLWRGARKFHLHAHDLPEFDGLCADIRQAHAAARNVAFHCVTRSELVYAMAALREAGVRPGDRIEHAAVVPPPLLGGLASLRLIVVTQPGFIAERGDAYLRDVADDDRPWLYRLRGLREAGIDVALSSDAPYTSANPWRAMQAAVDRRTPSGAVIGAGEAVAPEQAYELMTDDLRLPGRLKRRVEVGAPADLCLLPAPWAALRQRLSQVEPRLVLRRGCAVAGLHHLNG